MKSVSQIPGGPSMPHHDYSALLNFFKKCPSKANIIGLFINNYEVSQAEWLNPFAEYLNSKGYTTIGILTDKSAGHASLDKTSFLACIETSDVHKLDEIPVFVTSKYIFKFLYAGPTAICNEKRLIWRPARKKLTDDFRNFY